MPIRPSPMMYRCPACGWSKIVQLRSDALLPGDYYDCCPNCSHPELERRPASLVAQVFGLLDDVTGKDQKAK